MGTNQILAGSAICSVLIWLGISSIIRHFSYVFSKPESQTDINLITYPVHCCRFIGGTIMLVLALMLTLAMIYLEAPAQHLANLRNLSEETGKKLIYSSEQIQFATRYATFWASFLIVLLFLIAVSGLDAIFSWHHQKQLRNAKIALKKQQLSNKNLPAMDFKTNPPSSSQDFSNEN